MGNYSEDRGKNNLGGNTAYAGTADKREQERELAEAIRDDYKKQFQNKFNREFAKRFRNMKEQEEELAALKLAINPLLAYLEISNVNEAVEKAIATMNACGKKENIYANPDENRYAKWVSQANETAMKYPGFDFDKEYEEPIFRAGLNSGVPMDSLYRGLHFEELSKAIADAAAKAAIENIRSGNGRINEVGSEHSPSVRTRKKAGELTDSEIDEFLEKIKRGEKVDFSA